MYFIFFRVIRCSLRGHLSIPCSAKYSVNNGSQLIYVLSRCRGTRKRFVLYLSQSPACLASLPAACSLLPSCHVTCWQCACVFCPKSKSNITRVEHGFRNKSLHQLLHHIKTFNWGKISTNLHSFIIFLIILIIVMHIRYFIVINMTHKYSYKIFYIYNIRNNIMEKTLLIILEHIL